ncbi:MAG: histidinol phosphate phosphatase [Lachnospiraceae bacterium]|nr:histidinol phosphate phosphatase [Lachnospiraceae bacterium]
MRDVHIHFLHGNPIGYNIEFFEGFIKVAQEAGLDEIYLLEHTHQFTEFEKVYEPVKAYNDYQYNWITERMNGSIEEYIDFINKVQDTAYPVKVKFGLEVCYIPETADILVDILNEYDFDFLTGSVHWIDGWGFDHMGQKELWKSKNVEEVYKRYYEIMFDLCESSLFTGLAHPDSIKCFGYMPDIDLTEYYNNLALLLNKHGMYAENSGGLQLNYSPDIELGLNPKLLSILRRNKVRIETASDAHKQRDVGANIQELERMLKD